MLIDSLDNPSRSGWLHILPNLTRLLRLFLRSQHRCTPWLCIRTDAQSQPQARHGCWHVGGEQGCRTLCFLLLGDGDCRESERPPVQLGKQVFDDSKQLRHTPAVKVCHVGPPSTPMAARQFGPGWANIGLDHFYRVSNPSSIPTSWNSVQVARSPVR